MAIEIEILRTMVHEINVACAANKDKNEIRSLYANAFNYCLKVFPLPSEENISILKKWLKRIFFSQREHSNIKN